MAQDGICCADIIEAKANIEALEQSQKDWVDILSKQYTTIAADLAELRKTLANRPPIWTTVIISLLMGSMGVLVGIIVEISRHL